MTISGVTGYGASLNQLIAGLGTSRAAAPPRAGRIPGGQGAPAEVPPTEPLEQGPVGKSELSDEERAEVEKLRRRDNEVRRHEQTHKAAAGQYASGGPTFEYQTGPDGRRYVVEGKVKIDTSEIEGDPQATIRKMQQVRRAALAPAQPSAQDRQVAAQAAAAERSAQEELARQPDDEAPGAGGLSETPGLGREMSESPPSTASTKVAGSPAGSSKPTESGPAGNLAPRQSSLQDQAPLWASALAAQAARSSGRFIDVAV